jgi:hypothetical protein
VSARPSVPAGRDVVAGLRRFARPRRQSAPGPVPAGRCDLCGTSLDEGHRHLLSLEDRRILCACEPCWALRAGDPGLRPTGTRALVLDGFELPDELWAAFRIPIGLAFFFLSDAVSPGAVVALYPSPAGATESELDLDAWADLVAVNPVLGTLEPEVEALIVDRIGEPHAYAIAPIDRCYELVGSIKASWEGISGGAAVERAVGGFFARLRDAA